MPDLGVYVLNEHDEPQPLAECNDDSLAFCLRTLTDEGQITNASEVGILTLDTRKWLVNPWPKTPFGTRVRLEGVHFSRGDQA